MAKRKLAQRKAAAAKKAEQAASQDNHVAEKEEQKAENEVAEKRPRKRAKPSAQPEPEYFEDTRSLEDLWKEAFPVGTEWDQLHLVYQYNWDFTNLENAFEEGGELYGKRVYLFGCSEPQMVPIKGEMKITHVPAVVAVVSPFPPSDKIGINSVQREAEEIVPMKNMKMDWVPYIPFENRDVMVERLKSEIFILRCTQRRSALRHLKEERVKKFEYCLPYFYNPFKEDELEQSTVVTIMYEIASKGGSDPSTESKLPSDSEPATDSEPPAESKPQKGTKPRKGSKAQKGSNTSNDSKASKDAEPPTDSQPPVVCDFDWDFDELEEFTDDLISKEELPADHKESFKKLVKEEVLAAKKKNKEAREARKRALEAMSEETKAAIENTRFYKFYPVATPDTPDVSQVKSPFINRYYGKAHQVL